MKKTFAQLKKDLKEGMEIKTVLNNIRPERNGQVRKIGKVQTNAVAFEIPKEEQHTNLFGEIQTLSWLWWGKASCYDYDDNIFKVYHFDIQNNRVLDFVYEITGGEK